MYLMEKTLNHMLKSFKQIHNQFMVKQNLMVKMKLLDINPLNSIIIRTSWVYSYYGNNFVKTMLRLGKEKEELGVIFDQVGTPTYAKDLAKTILNIIPQIENSKS